MDFLSAKWQPCPDAINMVPAEKGSWWNPVQGNSVILDSLTINDGEGIALVGIKFQIKAHKSSWPKAT